MTSNTSSVLRSSLSPQATLGPSVFSFVKQAQAEEEEEDASLDYGVPTNCLDSPKSLPWAFLFNSQKALVDAIMTPTRLTGTLQSQESVTYPEPCRKRTGPGCACSRSPARLTALCPSCR